MVGVVLTIFFLNDVQKVEESSKVAWGRVTCFHRSRKDGTDIVTNWSRHENYVRLSVGLPAMTTDFTRTVFNTSSFCSISTSWVTIHSMELQGIGSTNSERSLWGNKKKPKAKSLLTT